MIPPIIPISSGRHGLIRPPKRRVQKLRVLQRLWSPPGPVTVGSGESVFGGTGTMLMYVGVDVRGPVNVIVATPGGGMISSAVGAHQMRDTW